MAKALGQRYPSSLLCSSVHPGICQGTNLDGYWADKPFSGIIINLVFTLSSFFKGLSNEKGAYTSIYTALSDDITPEKDNGKFYRPMPHEYEPTPAARDPIKIQKTWDWTVNELVKKGFLDSKEVASFQE